MKKARKTFYAQEIIDLFYAGKDTLEIAKILGVAESDIYNVLAFAKAAKEAFNDDTPEPPVSPIHEPFVESE
jgi:hypothetical protein